MSGGDSDIWAITNPNALKAKVSKSLGMFDSANENRCLRTWKFKECKKEN
jgi:hypothetical protein